MKLSDHRPLQTSLIVKERTDVEIEEKGPSGRTKQMKLKRNVTSEEVARVINSPRWPNESFMDVANAKKLVKTLYVPIDPAAQLKHLIKIADGKELERDIKVETAHQTLNEQEIKEITEAGPEGEITAIEKLI